MKHVNDIAEKYLCPGETQDTALMFVPSESVYAELHDGFDDIVQKAYRAQVMMVSPTLLMLAIQVIQQIQKDSQMREATDLIRTEVGHMMKDVKLLGERVRKLQTHFGQANEDLGNILTSANRIEKRAVKIEELEFDGDETLATNVIAAPLRKVGAGEF
jgi:DNA recombination protein RmuC